MALATLPTAPPAGPGPSNRRGLATWLLELADSDGTPIDDRRVLLPYTVSALNTRLGRPPRCGTLFRRVRDLHPAVSRSAGGLLLDRATLHQEAIGVRSRRSAADTPPAAAALTEDPAAATGPPGNVGEALDLARTACRLLDQALVLIATQNAMPPAIAPTGVAPRSPATGSREPREIAGSSQEGGREVAGSLSQTPPSLTVVPRPANPATPTGAPPDTSGDDIGRLLAPLVEVCRRTGLVGVTDTPGLRRALAPFSVEQTRHAVAVVCRLTKAGSINTSPVGWLVAKARDADPDYFPTAATPPPPPPSTGDRVAPDPALQAAERALAAADADELATLDEWIRTAAHHARIRHLIFDPGRAEMLHVARLEAWRTLQEEAS